VVIHKFTMATSDTTVTLSDINALLLEHSALTFRVRAAQRSHRDILRTLPSPPYSILQLPIIPLSVIPPRSPRSPSILRRKTQLEAKREIPRQERTCRPRSASASRDMLTTSRRRKLSEMITHNAMSMEESGRRIGY